MPWTGRESWKEIKLPLLLCNSGMDLLDVFPRFENNLHRTKKIIMAVSCITFCNSVLCSILAVMAGKNIWNHLCLCCFGNQTWNSIFWKNCPVYFSSFTNRVENKCLKFPDKQIMIKTCEWSFHTPVCHKAFLQVACRQKWQLLF